MSCVDVILGNGTTFLFVKCSPHSGISLSCLGISIGVFLSKTQLNYTQSHPGSSPQLQKTASQDSISSTAKSPHWNHTLRLQEVSTALVFFSSPSICPPIIQRQRKIKMLIASYIRNNLSQNVKFQFQRDQLL